jgi:hypothetical protein
MNIKDVCFNNLVLLILEEDDEIGDHSLIEFWVQGYLAVSVLS